MSLVTIYSITASLIKTGVDGADTYEVYVLLSDFVKVRITVVASNEPAAIAIGRKVIQKQGYLNMEAPVPENIQIIAKGSEGDVGDISIVKSDN